MSLEKSFRLSSDSDTFQMSEIASLTDLPKEINIDRDMEGHTMEQPRIRTFQILTRFLTQFNLSHASKSYGLSKPSQPRTPHAIFTNAFQLSDP